MAGKRPGPFGIGLIFDAEDNSDAAGILLMIPFGPLRAGINFSPWSPSPELSGLLYAVGQKCRKDHRRCRRYYVRCCKSVFRLRRTYFRFHTGPESATFQGTDAPLTGRFAVIPSDTAVTHGSMSLRYNNGRFFANAETVWIVGLTRNQKWLSSDAGTLPDGRSIFAPSHVEQWRIARR